MAISYRPTGEAQAAAQAGKTIGQGQARQKAAEQSQRMTEIQMAKDWEMQKMLLNSQQDFAHEIRLRQAELDKEARAMEWETEKMEIVSRLDFEQDEKERLRYKAEYKAGRDALNKNKDNMGNAEYAKAEYELNKLYAGKGIPEADSKLGYIDSKDDLFAQLQELQKQQGQKKGTPVLTKETFDTAKAQNKTIVKNTATGEIMQLPNDEVTLKVARGEAEIIENPSAETKTLNRNPMIYEVEEAASKGMAWLKNKSTEKIELTPIEKVREAVSSGNYEIAKPTPMAQTQNDFYNKGSFFF